MSKLQRYFTSKANKIRYKPFRAICFPSASYHDKNYKNFSLTGKTDTDRLYISTTVRLCAASLLRDVPPPLDSVWKKVGSLIYHPREPGTVPNVGKKKGGGG